MERKRNDLYYAESAKATLALYPDGKAGVLEKQDVEVERKVQGRRNDRVRSVKYRDQKLAQTALFDTVLEASLSTNESSKVKASETESKLQGYTTRWTIEDMPDVVIENFEAWKSSHIEHASEKFVEAAKILLASEEELFGEAVACPHCPTDFQYACYACGYARSVYKYPLVNMATETGESQDVPLDIAKVIELCPESISYRTDVSFTPDGTMSAQQCIVLALDHIPYTYGNEVTNGDLSVTSANKIAATISLPVASWSEKPQQRNSQPLYTNNPISIIRDIQLFVATDMWGGEIETTDIKHYQEKYESFINKMKALGEGAICAVVQEYYVGMGENEVSVSLTGTRLSSVGSPLVIARNLTVRWAIEEAEKAIDGICMIQHDGKTVLTTGTKGI